MLPAERPTRLQSRLRAVRLPTWLGPFRREPWVVLGPLVLVQWLCVLGLALRARHNAWLYYQGGDQTYYYTTAWMFSHWRMPTAEVGWGWSYLLAPVAGASGPNVLSGLPVVVLADAIVLLPAALLAVYGIGARIGGRLVGYWAAAVWIAVPFLAIPLFVARYHAKYVDQTLPQAFGLTPLADFPSMVLLLAGAYLIVRALDGGDWREAVLAGLVVGFAFCVKPSNVIFFFAGFLALLVARRWRELVVFGATLVPGVLLIALWKQRGLGTQPLFAGGDRGLAAVGVPLPGGTLAALGRYVNLDWHQLEVNRDSLREFFWSVRPLEWVPVAGVIALARRSLPQAALVGGWFLGFLLVKGTSHQASVEDASFWRLLMPSFPAFVFLLASVPLLVPKLGGALAVRFPASAARNPRRLERLVLAGAALLVVLPAVVLAATRVQVGPQTVKNDSEHTVIPVGGGLELTAGRVGGGTRLRWTTPPHGSVRVFYAVLRSRPRFPDPTNPRERTVVDGVSCHPKPAHASQDCHLYMRRVASVRGSTWLDHPPPGRWTYRVAVAANWIDDPAGGDLLLVSRPVTIGAR